GLALTLADDLIERPERIGQLSRGVWREALPQNDRLPRAHGHLIVRGRLRAVECGIDRVLAPGHDEVIDAVLLIRGGVALAPESVEVRLVLGEEQRRRLVAIKKPVTELGMPGSDHPAPVVMLRAQLGARPRGRRPPRVAEPEVRQEV